MRILIAEDDRVSRTFLTQFMSQYGECDVAVDGMEALDCIMDSIKNKEPYQLLCMDIMMPRVDGLKVLKVIRALEEQREVSRKDHLRIIMMTALTDEEHVDEAFHLGCDAYAAKPVDTEQIVEVMKSLRLIE
ncbi:MAG TPA: response regulator [Selenomonas sp.]|nr:response regulator [Selenomonadaceae bacterium]HCB93385.1 response regulator [Selenomonas sp.]